MHVTALFFACLVRALCHGRRIQIQQSSYLPKAHKDNCKSCFIFRFASLAERNHVVSSAVKPHSEVALHSHVKDLAKRFQPLKSSGAAFQVVGNRHDLLALKSNRIGSRLLVLEDGSFHDLRHPGRSSPSSSGLAARASRSSAVRLIASQGVIHEVLKIGGQMVPTERFVEAEVGMSFPKNEISERLYAVNGPWPDAFPFSPESFRRQDESDDGDFYSQPRLCYHIDEGAVRALTNYYKENIAAGSALLDICSSWVSHYPADFPETMSRISATGMNALELEANNQLSDFAPKNLNNDASLPYEDETFDVVTCVVSVDYLTKPLEVFKEVNRVLKPGGKFILSQSNRCFPSKAIAMWLGQDDLQHCLVIAGYFHYSKGWAPAKIFDISPQGSRTNDPLFIIEGIKGERPKLDASRWLKKK